MINKKKKQMSETFVIGVLLAVVGGFLDAYSYVIRGHVFATAETGNMVLMGINLVRGEYKNALHYLYPILSFGFGIIIAEMVRDRHASSGNSYFHWRQSVIIFEIAAVFIVAFIPVGDLNSIANVIISFVSSMQVETFRKFMNNPYSTTMCTGNLRSATEHLFYFCAKKDRSAGIKAVQYFSIIFIFIIGACLGVYFTGLFGQYSILLCSMILFIIFLVMFIEI